MARKINWEAKAGKAASRRAVRLVNEEKPAAKNKRPATESAGLGEVFGPVAERERLERLERAVRRGTTDRDLRTQILKGAREGLAKAAHGDSALSRRDLIGLEAVVLTDGTRPSLSVRNGFVNLTDPEVGQWETRLANFRDAIEEVIASVGRINVPVKPFFAGTGFVIAPGLVITNRHVAEAIATECDQGWLLKWPDATTIDFVAEEGSQSEATVRVLGVAFANPERINNTVNFAHLDVAILRCEPIGQADFPAAVTLDQGGNKGLARPRRLYALGFPAHPKEHVGAGRPRPGYETAEVMATVFSDTFGVKKLAPGEVDLLPADIAGNHESWVFTHDASTLSGNSGTALVDLDINGARVIGIHFAGLSREENYAHAFMSLRQILTSHFPEVAYAAN